MAEHGNASLPGTPRLQADNTNVESEDDWDLVSHRDTGSPRTSLDSEGSGELLDIDDKDNEEDPAAAILQEPTPSLDQHASRIPAKDDEEDSQDASDAEKEGNDHGNGSNPDLQAHALDPFSEVSGHHVESDESDLSDGGISLSTGDDFPQTRSRRVSSDAISKLPLRKQLEAEQAIDWDTVFAHLINKSAVAPFAGPHCSVLIPSGPDAGKYLHLPRKLPYWVCESIENRMLEIWTDWDPALGLWPSSSAYAPFVIIDKDGYDNSTKPYNWIPTSSWKLRGPPLAAFPITPSHVAPFSGPHTPVFNTGTYFNGYYMHIPRYLSKGEITMAERNIAALCSERWEWDDDCEKLATSALKQETDEVKNEVAFYQAQKVMADFLEHDLEVNFSAQPSIWAEKDMSVWSTQPDVTAPPQSEDHEAPDYSTDQDIPEIHSERGSDGTPPPSSIEEEPTTESISEEEPKLRDLGEDHSGLEPLNQKDSDAESVSILPDFSMDGPLIDAEVTSKDDDDEGGEQDISADSVEEKLMESSDSDRSLGILDSTSGVHLPPVSRDSSVDEQDVGDSATKDAAMEGNADVTLRNIAIETTVDRFEEAGLKIQNVDAPVSAETMRSLDDNDFVAFVLADSSEGQQHSENDASNSINSGNGAESLHEDTYASDEQMLVTANEAIKDRDQEAPSLQEEDFVVTDVPAAQDVAAGDTKTDISDKIASPPMTDDKIEGSEAEDRHIIDEDDYARPISYTLENIESGLDTIDIDWYGVEMQVDASDIILDTRQQQDGRAEDDVRQGTVSTDDDEAIEPVPPSGDEEHLTAANHTANANTGFAVRDSSGNDHYIILPTDDEPSSGRSRELCVKLAPLVISCLSGTYLLWHLKQHPEELPTMSELSELRNQLSSFSSNDVKAAIQLAAEEVATDAPLLAALLRCSPKVLLWRCVVGHITLTLAATRTFWPWGNVLKPLLCRAIAPKAATTSVRAALVNAPQMDDAAADAWQAEIVANQEEFRVLQRLRSMNSSRETTAPAASSNTSDSISDDASLPDLESTSGADPAETQRHTPRDSIKIRSAFSAMRQAFENRKFWTLNRIAGDLVLVLLTYICAWNFSVTRAVRAKALQEILDAYYGGRSVWREYETSGYLWTVRYVDPTTSHYLRDPSLIWLAMSVLWGGRLLDREDKGNKRASKTESVVLAVLVGGSLCMGLMMGAAEMA